MALVKQKWYPNLPVALGPELRDFARRAMDYIYTTRDTLGPLMHSSYGLGTQTITTDEGNAVEGISINLTRAGNWTVHVALQAAIADDSEDFTVGLRVGGELQPTTAVYQFPAQPVSIQLTGLWWINVPSENTAINPTISKSGGGGTSTLDLTNSLIVATWQGV